MDNKGCITCQKCEQVGINFFCGRKKLTQKQLYNKYGFCERYEPYEPKKQKEKQMTEQEYLQTCTTEQLAKVIINIAFSEGFDSVRFKCGTNYYCSSSSLHPYKDAEKIVIKEWLNKPHKE